MFEIYKKGQGSTARWIAAAGLIGLAAFGCYEFQDWLAGHVTRTLDIGFAEVAWSLLISGVLFIVAAVLVAMLVNQPRFVDYLIVSELELRKVSWPTREELKRQTTVVIITIIFFAVVLLLADIIFAFGSTRLYGF